MNLRCSECSSVVRPVVVFDIDGTLGDYYFHFREFAERYWDRRLERNWNGVGNWEEHLGLSREEYRSAKLAYRQGGMKRSLPVYQDANWLMKQLLSETMFEIWVATTRPWQSIDTIDRDTQWWLSRQGWKVTGLLYGEDKYEQLLTRIEPERVIGVFDDLGKYLQQAKNLGLPTWQPARVHNGASSVKWERRGSLIDARHWLHQNHLAWGERNK